MSTPRRRLIRPQPEPTIVNAQRRQEQLTKLHVRLDKERISLTRWLARMRRAFHAVERQQKRVTRIEKQIAKQET